MGIVSGSVSYLRFVAGNLPDAFEETYAEALRTAAFHEIDPHSDLEVSRGWVRFDDAFSSEFDPGTLVEPGGNIFLRLRIDTLKIPAGTLKAYVDKDARERAAKVGRDKLVKRELDTVKADVKKLLRQRSLPRMQLLEMVWNVASGEVRLMSTSKSAAAHFVDVFEKTFSQTLRPVGLLTILWLRGVKDEEIDALGNLEPERFHLLRT